MPRKSSQSLSSQSLDFDALPEELSADWSYEQTIARIEAITHDLETGELPLADVFSQFAEAVSALQQCDRFLQDKQTQASLMIETLVGSEEEESP